MRRIYKYPLDPKDTQRIHMPDGAEILHVEVQGVPCLWAIVDPGEPVVLRTIHARGTGHPMGDAEGCTYIGTIHMPGPLVFHFFDGGC